MIERSTRVDDGRIATFYHPTRKQVETWFFADVRGFEYLIATDMNHRDAVASWQRDAYEAESYALEMESVRRAEQRNEEVLAGEYHGMTWEDAQEDARERWLASL